MTLLLRMGSPYPRPVRVLLLGSLLLGIARAATLPYIIVYLSTALHLTSFGTGLLLGGSMILGVAFGMYGGYAVDRWPAFGLTATLIAVIAACFMGAFAWRSAWGFFALLTVLNSAFAVLDTSVKACFGDFLPPGDEGRPFRSNTRSPTSPSRSGR